MFISLFISCQDDTVNEISENQHTSSIISGVDISDYPKVSSYNPTFYDENNNEISFINSLIQNGVNTIRLRLWVNPVDESSSLDEVKEFSNELKSLGFKKYNKKSLEFIKFKKVNISSSKLRKI